MEQGNEHFERWLDVLSETDLPQATGTLRVISESQASYCCLGIACTLAPNGEAFLSGTYTTLPAEVAEWMGLRDLARADGRQWDRIKEQGNAGWDIVLDGTIVIPFDDMGDDGEQYDMSAASLNDDGFTFAQIADLIRYFGIRELV
jgi:hypothetical protein